MRWPESMANCKSCGASHRKKGGHVTPKLGTAERQTAASMFTQVNVCCVNKTRHVLSDRDIERRRLFETGGSRASNRVNALKRKSFL
jgi:hypothetical protein